MVLAAPACASARSSRSTVTARPRLTALAPSEVQLSAASNAEIELRGRNFSTRTDAPANTVRIGALELRAVPSSANGTVIRVTLPETVPSGGEAPPARWMSGRYAVTVTTTAGTSDTLLLTIAAGPRNP